MRDSREAGAAIRTNDASPFCVEMRPALALLMDRAVGHRPGDTRVAQLGRHSLVSVAPAPNIDAPGHDVRYETRTRLHSARGLPAPVDVESWEW